MRPNTKYAKGQVNIIAKAAALKGYGLANRQQEEGLRESKAKFGLHWIGLESM